MSEHFGCSVETLSFRMTDILNISHQSLMCFIALLKRKNNSLQLNSRQFSVTNGRLRRAVQFGRFCRGESRNFAKFSAEKYGPYLLTMSNLYLNSTALFIAQVHHKSK